MADLLFGEGVMSITSTESGVISGTFDFGRGFEMEFKGTVSDGLPVTVRFEGKGVGAQNKDWLYEYDGSLGYHWPHGVDQKDSIVGTVLRAQPHSNGQAPAGVTASFIAVRQEAAPNGVATAPRTLMNLAAPEGVPKMESPQARKRLKEAYMRAEEENNALNLKPVPPPKPLQQAPALKLLNDLLPQGLRLDQPQFAPPTPATPSGSSLKPLTLQSQNGRLEVNLTIDYNKQKLQIGNDEVQLRTYNGQLVGPVLRVKAGDVLVVNLQNNLPGEPAMPPGTNGHHEWNYTNLHFHGLHVAPQGTKEAESDNVLLTIPPGQSQHYEVHIPKDHPAGTFWYHAHRHGSTAAQVSSGMSGALIIDRDDAITNLDSIPEVAAAAQEIMVLQAIPYLKFPAMPGEVELFDHPSVDGKGGLTTGSSDDDMFSPNNWYKLRRYYLVNGEKIPTITVAPGEVRRLRVVMSGQREFVRLRIGRDADGRGKDNDQIKFHEIAMDGLVTGMLTEREEVDLYPGYRSDLLIQPDVKAGGTYYLVDMMTAVQAPCATGADGSPERTSIIARIIVRGSPVSMKLPEPTALAKHVLPDLPDRPGLTTRYAFYGIVIDGGVQYFVGDQSTAPNQPVQGREFNPAQERTLPFGQIEKWEVGSRNSQGITVAHPFHIHINPFKVLKVTDANGSDVLKQEFGGPVWRDTLAMKQGFTYTLITQYSDFAGSFVDHCHILDHEDHGMMEKVTIVKGGVAQASPAPAPRARLAGANVPELLGPYAGRPLLAVTIRSVECGLCRQQMAAFEKAATGADWPGSLQTVFVAPDAPAAVEEAIRGGLVTKGTLLADPRGTVLNFIDPSALRQGRGHGILLMDAEGLTLFKSSGQEPLLEIASLQPHLELLVSTPPAGAAGFSSATVAETGNGGAETAAPQVAIDIWKTPATNDDYITWAPTPCQIRLAAPQPADIDVTLTNDPEEPIPSGRIMPLDGDAAFAATLAPGQTARETTLKIRLPKDGSPVSFYIAGKFPRASSADKDCIIEVHQGDASGPVIGTQALMVRVRKDHRALTENERQRFLEALDWLQHTAVAPDGNGSMYMYFVNLHRTAARGQDFGAGGDPLVKYQWPDLAHKGPGFISWHRAYLLQFERALQVKYPDVTLPYWVMPEPSMLFTQDFVGANPSTGSGDVTPTFSPNNPLFGWTADIDGENEHILRHPYGRNPGDPNFRPFLTDTNLFKYENFSLYPQRDFLHWNSPKNSFTRVLEQNPHNEGHNWVGNWMANCETSPRDPIFWVFHAGIDRQWAKWQVLKTRFNPDGSADSFCPTGTIDHPGPLCHPPTPPPPVDCNDVTPNGCVPINHHLLDVLWPWSGKFGQAGTMKASLPQQDMAARFLRPFQAAANPQLWPAQEQTITNGDMIDFMGKTPQRAQMGFCYDDTPYDPADQPPAPALHLPPTFLALQGVGPAALKVNEAATRAMSGLLSGDQAAQSNAASQLQKIQGDDNADVHSRRTALRILTALGDVEPAFQVARSNAATDHPLKAEALSRLFQFAMLSPDGAARRKEVMEELERGLESDDQEVRSVALWALVGKDAPQSLLQSLYDSVAQKPGAKFPVAEAIHALVACGKVKKAAELIRPHLASADAKILGAAAAALGGDAQSSERRAGLVLNAASPTAARSAALQSLRPDQPENIALLLTLAADPTQNSRLRGEAMAQLGLWARTTVNKLTAAQLEDMRSGLRAITDAGASAFGPAQTRALRSIEERLNSTQK